MSVLPPSYGSPSTPYYVPYQNGTLQNPVINPISLNGVASTLEMRNFQVFATDPSNATRVIHYMPYTTGGGLTQNHYQLFMYGASVGGSDIAECWDIASIGNNYAMMSINRAIPLDSTRIGTIVGTGALQTVACPSITPGSLVQLAFVAGTPAVAQPVIVNSPTGFSLTLPAGAVYNYEIVG